MAFWQKHGILAKSRHLRHLMKITISVFPRLSTVPNHVQCSSSSFHSSHSNVIVSNDQVNKLLSDAMIVADLV